MQTYIYSLFTSPNLWKQRYNKTFFHQNHPNVFPCLIQTVTCFSYDW